MSFLERFENVVHVADGFGAFVEQRLFVGVETEVDDLFPAVPADDDGNTEADILLAVFAIQGDAAGEEFLFVPQDAFYQGCAGSAGGIPGGGADQLGQGSAAYHGVGDDLLLLFFAEEFCYGGAVPGCQADQGDHGSITMAADYYCIQVSGAATEVLAQLIFKPGAIQRTTHTDDAVLWQTCRRQGQVGHRIHWIADDDEDGVGRKL